MPWGGAPKCPACDRSVYPVEQIIAADRRPFHPQCIKCQMQGCGNDLTARGLHKYEGYNICDRCHEMIFINKTYGPAEGMETAEERKRREEEERLARERAEKAKRDRLCPECSKKTFDNDSEMLAPDLYYHRGCIKCSECGRQPDSETPIMMAPRECDDVFAAEILDPYCKFCYAKKFKMSAINIQDILEIAPTDAYCI